MIPSSRALLSRDKRLPLDTYRKTENQFSTFDSPQRFSSKEFHWRRAKKSRSSPSRSEGKNKSDKWRRTKLWRNSNDRWLRVLNIRLIFRRTTWSDSKDSKCRNYNATGPLIHHNFLGVENKIQNTGLKWFWFSVGSYVMDQRSGDGWFFGWAKSSRSVYGKDFPNFEMLDAKIASALNKIIQNSQFNKKVTLEELESPKRGAVSARETNRPHDIRLLSSDWSLMTQCWVMLIYSLLLFTWWQHSGIRYEMGRSSIIDDKNSTRWNLGMSVQIEDTWVWSTQKPYWNCTTWWFIRRHRFPTIKSWKPWWRGCMDQKLRSRNFDARHGRIESGAVVKSRKGISGVEGGKGICYQWKGEGQCSQGDRCSFRHEEPKIVRKNQNTLPPHLPSQPHHEVEVCRGREVSEAKSNHGSILRRPRRYHLRGACTRTPCE